MSRFIPRFGCRGPETGLAHLATNSVVRHDGAMRAAGRRPPDRQEDGSSDRRWVIVAEDGRYSTIGRASDPTDAEIGEAEDALRRQGLSGWLAVMSGSAYGSKVPSLMAVRPLASPTKHWEDASAACLAAIAARHKDLGD